MAQALRGEDVVLVPSLDGFVTDPTDTVLRAVPFLAVLWPYKISPESHLTPTPSPDGALMSLYYEAAGMNGLNATRCFR